MPLDAGTRLGPYEIVEMLGAGGMGEVYRARDTRLDRMVALKVSAEQFTDRFAREAKVISSLNHARICTLHDVGPNYLVMELVEGETLAERIGRGPIALEDALPLARQIVEGLEAAHEKGVIHRDLKPANVKITPDGDVKVLDFGLAKVAEAAATAQAGSDPAASPTMTIQATRAGVILGTAAYMPPEQARGNVVDRRADSWAFGCVLYEMLTGKRLFDGESTTDVLAAVVRAEPDWKALPAGTPAPIRRLLKRCLEKDRKRRLPDIGVARLEIDDALMVPEVAPGPAAPARPRRAPWVVAAIALLVAGGAILWSLRAPVPENWTGTMIGGSRSAFLPRLSPDGQLLTFLSFEGRTTQLAVMKPNGGSWTLLTHERDRGCITTAAWAPDGSKIYFDRVPGAPGGIYSIPPLGGEPRLLLEDASGPEPLADGSLIALKLTDRADMQLVHFWPDTGKLEPLPAYYPLSDITPMIRAMPSGKEVVYYGATAAKRSEAPRLWILDLASGKARDLNAGVVKLLINSNSWAPLEVSRDGQFVYALIDQGDNRVLMEMPVSGSRKSRPILSFARTSAPVSMNIAPDGSMFLDLMTLPKSILNIAESGGAMREFGLPLVSTAALLRTGQALIAISTAGKCRLNLYSPGGDFREILETSEACDIPGAAFGDFVAFQLGSGAERRTALAGLRDGRIVRRFAHHSDAGMAPSPDGKTLYYAFDGAIWAQAVEGGEPKKIAEGIDVALDPAGRFLYLKRAVKGKLTIVRVALAGGTEELLPTSADYRIAEPALSEGAVDARGRILVTVVSVNGFFYETAILDPLAKTFTPLPVTAEGDFAYASWAPDGRVLARGERYLSALWRYQRSAAFK